MFDKLLLYDETQMPFDPAAFEKCVAAIPGVAGIKTSPEVIASVECVFECQEGRGTIRLISTRKMIALEGDFGCIVAAAFELNLRMVERLHLIDEGYSFDVLLDNASSIEQLKELLSNLAD